MKRIVFIALFLVSLREVAAQEAGSITLGAWVRVQFPLQPAGDSWLVGSVVSLDADTLVLKSKGRPTPLAVPLASVTRFEVRYGQGLLGERLWEPVPLPIQGTARMPDHPVTISLKDGTALTGKVVGEEEKSFAVVTLADLEVKVPKSSILSIEPVRGQVVGGLLYRNPGRVVLAKQGRTIEIAPDHRVSIKWLAGRVVYSTQARVDGEVLPVGGHIVEADEQYLHLRSEDWHSLEDLPRNYLKSKEVKITASKGGHNPIIAIPIHQVKEIGIYKGIKPPVLSRFSKKDVFIGALGGVSVVMGSVVSTSISPEQDQGGEVLAATLVGAAVGAIVYPAYKILNPRRDQDLTIYPVDDQEGWKIEISRE